MNEGTVQSLRDDVAQLALPEGRMVGTAGHKRARGFLCDRMEGLGLERYNGAEGYEQPYQHGSERFFNLVGVIPGTDRLARPVLLGAHYDSVIAAPCADDNAAAVAITLAIAERLRNEQPMSDVLVVIFDAEEPPYFLMPAMGSIRFVLDQMDARGVGLALIQDLTGHDVKLPLPGLNSLALSRMKDLLFVTGAESHRDLPELVRTALNRSDLPLVATLNNNVGDMSDHHMFRRMGVPYLFFSCGRWEHYHRTSDTPEKLNYEKMARIAALLTDVTLACAGREFPKGTQAGNTVEFEIALLERAFGALLRALLHQAGLKKLQDRADLDALVSALSSFGL